MTQLIKRICIFGDSFLPRVGGMEYVMHYLAEALSAQGCDVTLIAKRMSWNRPALSRNYRWVRYGAPLKGSGRTGLDFMGALWTVWRQSRKAPFDVVHCHGVAQGGSRAAAIKRLMGIPLVMTPHGEDIQRLPEIGYGLRLRPRWDRRIRKNLACADAVTTISESMRRELTFVPSEKIMPVPNGIHTQRFGPGRSSFLADHLSISPDIPIILSVGRNHIKKGYRFGIAAAAHLVKNYGLTNFRYVIVGRNASTLQPEVERYGVGDYVRLLEQVPPDKLRACYNSSAIFFSPSILEGLSLVSIEAMACGLPLVVTDVPGNQDIVAENACGIIVGSAAPDEMAEGLRQLLSDHPLRKELGHTALARSGRYDWTAVAQQYLTVYAQAKARSDEAGAGGKTPTAVERPK